MRKCLDVANYTPIPTAAEVACLVADGYERGIVGASYGSVARGQLEAFQDGGMEIEAYAWVSFADNWQHPLDHALAVIQGLPVTRLWMDCEEDPGAADVLTRIDDALAYVHNVRPDLEMGIYTGGWWWKPNAGNSTRYGAMPLWTADYLQPRDEADKPYLYGGWTEAAIWQTAGSVQLCGLNADDNVILEEDELTPAQMQEIKNYFDMKLIQMIGWINAQGFHKQ
jgi:hypothetical protein